MTTEMEINECASNPCAEWATCIDSLNYYNCTCPLGFTGVECEIDIDECASDPCASRATCADRVNHYLCNCPFGFEGVHCEIDIYPNFNYSNLREIAIENLTLDFIHHPYYEVAQLYNPVSPTSSAQILKHSTVTTDLGRAEIGEYYKLDGTRSWIDPTVTSYKGNELRILNPLDNRPDGFAFSLWVYLDKTSRGTSPSTLYNSGRAYDNTLPHVAIVLTVQKVLSFRVNDGTSIIQIKMINAEIPWNFWANLAFTWRADLGPSAYINGDLLTRISSSKASEAAENSDPWKVSLGANDRYGTNAMSPLVIADFASWPRYLYPFEINHYLGMTDGEYSNLRESSRYWTTDAFIRRDQQVLAEYQPPIAVASTAPMSIPKDQPLQLVPGRDGKGNALYINGSAGHWLHLGVQEDTCLSNPYLCPEGVTVTVICKMVPPEDTSFHFVFSSGAQSTRGFALYQRERKLGAIVTDGDSKWVSEVTAPFDWAHIGIAWRKETGLNLFINGNLEGADWSGIRKIRDTDADTRVIVGRRNDFLGDFSNVFFEELAVREKFVEPWEAREVFKIYGNSNYDTAKYFWNYKRLISSTFKILSEKSPRDRSFIGPSGEVVTENPPVIHLNQPTSHLNLGDFNGECLTETSSCSDGLSISIWIRISHRVFSPRAYLLSSGAEDSTYHATGVSIYLENLSFYVQVNTNWAKWTMSTSLDYLPNDQWTNLAVTWDSSDNTSSSIQTYIDGVKPSRDLRNYEEFSKDITWFKSATNLVVGRHNYEDTGYFNLRIHSLSVWESYTAERKVSRLLGLSEPELQCYRDADFCWMFEYPTLLLHPFYPSATGISFTTSRNLRGRAICTDGINGWVMLGNYTAACPNNPEVCANGFAIAMWMKLYTLPQGVEAGYVMSLGAEREDEIGLVVTQTAEGLEVTIADDDTMWQGSAAASHIKYGDWIYFGIVWSSRTGLQLSIDGESVGILLKRVATERLKDDYAGLRLGGPGGDSSGYVKACFDDIAIYIPEEDEELPTLGSLTGKETSSYNSADEHYDVTDPDGPVEGVNTETTTDRTNQADGAADTSSNKGLGYLSLGSFSGKCISDPSRCNPAGVTISMWLKMGTTDHFSNTNTNPGGLGYILSSGAQNIRGRGFATTYNGSAIAAYVNDGSKEWQVEFAFDLGQDWHNFALTWSSTGGLAIFIDGSVQASDKEGIRLSSSRLDFFNSLHLGKRNDGNNDYLGAAFDDPAIWYHAFEEDDPETAAVVKGDVPDPVATVITESDLDGSAPDTGKPDCQILHEADCARTMNELFTVISDEPDITSVVVRSATLRMQALAEPDLYLSSTELDYATKNLKTVTDIRMPDSLNETACLGYLEDYIIIASSLLDQNRSDEWYTVHQQRKPGTTSIMQNLEFYGMNISQRIDSRDAKLMAESENIILTVDKVYSSTFYQPYVLPKKTERRWRIADEHWRQLEDSIELPVNLFDNVGAGNVDEGTLVFTVFDTLQDMAPVTTNGLNKVRGQTAWLNSHVLSLDIYPRLEQDLEEPVVIVFKHVVPLNSSFVKKPACGFWNFDVEATTNGAWDNEGCETVKTNKTHTTCHCHHLTHFVIVMEPIIPPGVNIHLVRTAWIARVLGLLSAWFLIMLLYNFITTDRLRTLRHTIHLHQCFAALMATLAFVVSDFARLNKLSCMICGACMHFFYLAFIYWVAVEMMQLIRDIWYGLHKNDAIIGFALYRNKMGWYTLLAWGVPTVALGITLGLSSEPYYEHQYGLCWLSDSEGLLWSFTGPCSIALCINMILMAFIGKGMTKRVKLQDKTTGFRSGVRGTAFLTLTFAATWLIGCYAIYGGPVSLYYIFIVCNSLLGIFMFICHGMANIEVRAIICQNDPDFELSAVQTIYIPPSSEPTSEVSIDKPAYIS